MMSDTVHNQGPSVFVIYSVITVSSYDNWLSRNWHWLFQDKEKESCAQVMEQAKKADISTVTSNLEQVIVSWWMAAVIMCIF